MTYLRHEFGNRIAEDARTTSGKVAEAAKAVSDAAANLVKASGKLDSATDKLEALQKTVAAAQACTSEIKPTGHKCPAAEGSDVAH